MRILFLTGDAGKNDCYMQDENKNIEYYISKFTATNDNVQNPELAAILAVFKIFDKATGRSELKIGVSKMDKEEEHFLGNLYTKISEIDKNLIDLIDYAVGLSRKNVVQIKKLILDNIRNLPVDDAEEDDRQDFLKELVTFIHEHSIQKERIRNKNLYCIEKDIFDEQFDKRSNILEIKQYLTRKDIDILYTNKNRLDYRKADNKYYIAVQSDNETIRQTEIELGYTETSEEK